MRSNQSLPTILVTGATGKTGGSVTSALLREGYPVRAVIRREDMRSEQLRSKGAETVLVNVFDTHSWVSAMRGVKRAYFVPFFDPFMIQSATAFSVAAREARLEAIVQLSQWIASPRHPSLHTRQLWQTEQLFSAIPGVAHTILNPGYFADNILRLMDFATVLGIYPNLTAESLSAPISNEDIARAAVALLKDPDAYAGKSYRPTGPELVNGAEIARTLASVLGKRVASVPMPMWMMLRAAKIQKVNPFELDGFRFYVQDHLQGAFEVEGVNSVLEDLTGKPAEPFSKTVERYSANPRNQRNAANWWRVFVQFNLVPFVPGYDFDRIATSQGFPRQSHSEFTLESETWRMSHLNIQGTGGIA
ncbi:MAG: NmrA family NAD(P)-binding protein [Armatimonadota bacterium]